MSRLLRPFLLPALLSVAVVGCSQPYKRLYSPARRTYKPPAEVATDKAEAEKLLGAGNTAPASDAGILGGAPGGLPPAGAMPMGDVPAADPLNMQPAADPNAAPAAPAPGAPPPL